MNLTKYEEHLDHAFMLLFKTLGSHIDQEIFGISMTLFHYYTYYKHLKNFDKNKLALSCVFLATKLSGSFFKVDKLVTIYQNNGLKAPILTEKEIVFFELDLLNFLGFEIEIETTYSHLDRFIRSSSFSSLVQILSKSQIYDDSRLRNLSYNIAHDSYRRPFCIVFKPEIVASCCIGLAFVIESTSSQLESQLNLEIESLFNTFFKSDDLLYDFKICFAEIVDLFNKKLRTTEIK